MSQNPGEPPHPLYRAFEKALQQAHDSTGFIEARRLYKELGRVHAAERPHANRHFDRKFGDYAREVLQRAEVARQARRCDEAQKQVQLVLDVVDDYPAALAALEKKCEAQAKAPPSPPDYRKLQEEASRLYGQGQYQKAMEQALALQRAPRPEQRQAAWMLIGKAACKLHNGPEAAEAMLKLPEAQQSGLILICKKDGLNWTGSDFEGK